MRSYVPWFLLCVTLCNSACERESSTASPQAPGARYVQYPLFAVPSEAAGLYRDLRKQQSEGLNDQILPKYLKLLDVLQAAWGPEDFRAAPYHYNYCVALSLLGRDAECLKAVDHGLTVWPHCLQHRLLAATVRMNISGRRGTLIPGTESAVDAILDPIFRDSISKLRVDPAALHLQWGSVLFGAGNIEKALEQCKITLILKPGDEKATTLAGRSLLALRRAREVLDLLERDKNEEQTLAIRLLTGTAHLEIDESQAAWKTLEPGIDQLSGNENAPLALEYRLTSARALNRLERFAAARSILLGVMTENPLDTKLMHQMVVALRGLNLTQLSDALLRRIKELSEYEHHSGEARKSRRAGMTASIAYHEALAFLSISQMGQAIDTLQEPISAYPKLVLPRLLEVEMYLQVGDIQRALSQNLKALRETNSPTIRAVQARLLIRTGQLQAARGILKSLETQPSLSPRRDALLATFCARSYLELRDLAPVQSFVMSVDSGSHQEPEALEVALLCKSYSKLMDGNHRESLNLLTTEIQHTPGGGSWQRAMKIVARSLASDNTPLDPSDPGEHDKLSDLIDQPWLVAQARNFPGDSEATRKLLDTAEDVITSRNRLLSLLAERREGSDSEIWLQLIDLLSDRGASRKRREAAWYRWHSNRDDLQSLLYLLESLGRDEEIFSRRHLISHAMKASRDPQLAKRLQSIDRRLHRENER